MKQVFDLLAALVKPALKVFGGALANGHCVHAHEEVLIASVAGCKNAVKALLSLLKSDQLEDALIQCAASLLQMSNAAIDCLLGCHERLWIVTEVERI